MSHAGKNAGQADSPDSEPATATAGESVHDGTVDGPREIRSEGSAGNKALGVADPRAIADELAADAQDLGIY